MNLTVHATGNIAVSFTGNVRCPNRPPTGKQVNTVKNVSPTGIFVNMVLVLDLLFNNH